jgi:hypothetical protein
MPDKSPLAEEDRSLLDFEAQWPGHSGAKERAMRQRFGVGPARYYQALDTVIDSPAALAAEPLLVHRLLRLREQRSRSRAARILGRTAD